MTAAEPVRARRTALVEGTGWWASLLKAIGFETAQHARNRLSLTLVVLFIPIWLGVVHAIIPPRPISYQSRITGAPVDVDAGQLALISAVLNAVTLIIGFMLFAAVRRSREFDQRLVRAGYPRPCLLLAKLVALVLVALTVGGYATVVLWIYTDVRQPGMLFLSLVASGLVYGGLGIALGVAVSTELAGMFVIIMISLVDVMVQNPLINPGKDQSALQFLPTYGPMQSAVAATFTDARSGTYLLYGPAWLGVFALFGLAAFYLRTKDHVRRDARPEPPPSAAVTVWLRADGTFEVVSHRGSVVVHSEAEAPESVLEGGPRSL